MEAFTPDAIDAPAGRLVTFHLGDRQIPFTVENFILSFSLPNFHFHATTAYDILRQHGAPVGECVYGAVTAGIRDCEATGQDIDACNQYFQLDALVTFLPYWFRFLQQLRRYASSGYTSRRDLANAAKYFSSLCVVSLSWADHASQEAGGSVGHKLSKWALLDSPYKFGWAVAVVVCATFKLVWDIKQDWKLMEPGAPHWLLRRRLVYPRWVYYYAICQDAVLRFNFVLSISPSFFHLDSISDMVRPEESTVLHHFSYGFSYGLRPLVPPPVWSTI